MQNPKSDPGQPDNLTLMVIGRIVTGWSGLDFLLSMMIHASLRISDEYGFLITGKMDTRPKSELLRSIWAQNMRILRRGRAKGEAKDVLVAIMRRVADFTEEVARLNPKRNTLAHGYVYTDKNDHFAGFASARGGVEMERRITRNEIAALAHDMDELLKRGGDLLTVLAVARGTPPEEYPPPSAKGRQNQGRKREAPQPRP